MTTREQRLRLERMVWAIRTMRALGMTYEIERDETGKIKSVTFKRKDNNDR